MLRLFSFFGFSPRTPLAGFQNQFFPTQQPDYNGLVARIAFLLEQGRRTTVRTTNAILRASYWEVGQQIVEYEQGGQPRAEYGEELLEQLGRDPTARFDRGFGWRNLFSMRTFYLGWEILTPIIPSAGLIQTRNASEEHSRWRFWFVWEEVARRVGTINHACARFASGGRLGIEFESVLALGVVPEHGLLLLADQGKGG